MYHPEVCPFADQAVSSIKGFQSKKASQLKATLEASGAFDERPVLVPELVEEHVLEAVYEDVRDGRASAGDVRAFVAWVLQVSASAA